jgi:GNAT superfamily N-acetyltransferase
MNWEWSVDTGAGELTCRPLTVERFADLEALFELRSVTRDCYCMHWRRPDGGFRDDRSNRDRFLQVTTEGPPPGLIGYIDERPVAWVQIAPRDDFPTLDRSRNLARVDETDVWSVNCFFTHPSARRSGLGQAMLDGAVEYARSQGATVIEGYPFDAPTTSPVNLYTGTAEMFASHDFVEVARRRSHRPIVRLDLGSRKPTDAA